MFPKEPLRQKKFIDTVIGKVETHAFIGMLGRDALYSVLYGDYPGRHHVNPNEFCEGMGNKLAAQLQVEKKNEKTVFLGKIPGREIQVKTPKSHTTFRFFLVKQRFYQLVVGSPPNRSLSDQDINTFFNSFRLLSNHEENTAVSAESLKIDGIMFNPDGKRAVLIGEEMAFEGDVQGGYKIEKIYSYSVDVIRDGER